MPTQPSAGVYHWLATLTYQGPHGSIGYTTQEGLLTATRGATRQDLTRAAIKMAREQGGAPRDSFVLFFSLEPNRLG